MNKNDHGAPLLVARPRCAAGTMLRLLALITFASAQTGTTPAPVPYSSLEPTPKGTLYPSITPYPTLFPTATGQPTVTGYPTLPPTLTSWPTTASGSPTLSLYPTQSSDKSGNSSCSLCDAGATLGLPDKRIPPYVANITCSDLAARLANARVASGSAACETILEAVTPTLAFVEIQAYCGCSGSKTPDLCTFCETGYYVPPSNDLNVVEVPGVGNVTCEQADAFTKYIRDEKNCLEWSLALTDPCCAKGSAAPSQAPAPTAPSSPTAPTPPTAPTSEGFIASRGFAGLGAIALGWVVAVTLLS